MTPGSGSPGDRRNGRGVLGLDRRHPTRRRGTGFLHADRHGGFNKTEKHQALDLALLPRAGGARATGAYFGGMSPLPVIPGKRLGAGLGVSIKNVVGTPYQKTALLDRVASCWKTSGGLHGPAERHLQGRGRALSVTRGPPRIT